MTIVFFGTTSFSAAVLEALAQDTRFRIAAVVTTPDKPVGRKQEIQESAVAQLGFALELPVHKLPTLRTPEAAELLNSYDADIFLVVAYGKIIPQNILDLPKIAPINIHGSLLPKYRGAAPIHAALLHGENQTGITIMQMDAEVDHGDTYVMHSLEIEPDECEPQLETRLAALAVKHIGDDLEHIVEGALQRTPQDHTNATFTKIIDKEDGRIDWNKSANEIYNQFRAYYEWPGVFTSFHDKRLKVLDCEPLDTELKNVNPGIVITEENKIVVACKTGGLLLLLVQPEGKQPMLPQEFVNGHKDFIGTALM